MPAVATDALLSDEDYGECGIKLAGTEFEFHLGAVPAIAFGILSGCPVLTIPSFVRNGILRAHRWSRDRTTVRPYDRPTAPSSGKVARSRRLCPIPVNIPTAMSSRENLGLVRSSSSSRKSAVRVGGGRHNPAAISGSWANHATQDSLTSGSAMITWWPSNLRNSDAPARSSRSARRLHCR